MNSIRRFIYAAMGLALLSGSALGQNYNVREEVRNDWMKSSGLDNLLDFNVPALTAAPDGFEPFYVSHYGRHGSRYAYTASAFTDLLKLLRKADAEDNLTAYGKVLYKRLDDFYSKSRHKVGNLTTIGWEQHQKIARCMLESFPEAFPDGARVDALASSSTRSILSMSSFCLSLQKEKPGLEIYEHQGFMEIQASAPNMGENELRYKGPDMPFPYDETVGQFFLRRFPEWKNVYARMFKDADKALGNKSPFSLSDNVYMIVAGMNSLPEDVREDFSDIFTPEEYAAMWEADNYLRFWEYYKYKTSCCSVVDDIVNRADPRIAEAERGADLRFGHDHVLMSLLMIMDVDGFGTVPSSPDEIAYWFQTYRSPMATNLQFVFYRNAEGTVLVKLLFNGCEAKLGKLASDCWPYYRWDDARAYLKDKVREFSYPLEN